MKKLIFAINITIDGFADHTAVIADDEPHDFYTNLLNDADTLLFGRKTYQLMESYWPQAQNDPQATKSMIEFANKINSLPKIVFSKTLHTAEWSNTKIVEENIVEEVQKLKNQYGFSQTGDNLLEGVKDSTGGFTTVLDGLKAFLEHSINLNLIADKFPKELTQHGK